MSPRIVVAVIVSSAVFAMMIVESLISRANERKLRARGAVEAGEDVYTAMAWVYPLSFLAMGIEGASVGPVPGATTVVGALIFGAAKALKYWAIASLGSRWTFRVLVPPDARLVTHGPYAWMRHPNYLGVIGELAGFALLVGAVLTGPVSVIAFSLLIRRRIHIEERALGLRGPVV
jgi:methyltransferase